MSLRFPLKHIAGPAKRGNKKKPLIVYEAHGSAEEMAELGVFCSRIPPQDSEALLLRFGKPLCYFTLSSGEHVAVAARLTKLVQLTLPDGKPLLEGRLNLGHALAATVSTIAELAKSPSLGMVVFNKPSDGEGLVVMEMGGVTVSRNVE